MRVLMVNHPEAESYRGGDLTQMRQSAAALRSFGVQVEESFSPTPNAAGFDLAHVFNLRTIAVTPGQVAHLKRQGIPVVLSPIYLNPSIALWGARAVQGIFQDDPPPEVLAQRLASLRDRSMRVHQVDGPVLTADGPNRPHADYDRLQREAVQNVDLVLANSWLEVQAMTAALHTPRTPAMVAPLGADLLFSRADPEPFAARYGLRDFVLQVGRIEPTKNQLMLVHALRDSGLRLVLIGSARHASYLELVCKHGPKDLVVIPHLPPEELASAYAAARVHVLPSWSETCGLVNLEAGLAGCSIVAGSIGYEREFLIDLVEYCDPADVDSIRDAVQSAWQNHERQAERRKALRQRILKHFTWERCAATTFNAYQRVIRRK